MFTVGWPAYLIFNATGHETSDFASHFLPNCSLFSNMKKSKRWKVQLSTFGLVAWTAFLIYTPYLFPGFTYSMLLRLYALPLSVNFFFLTSITYLQHTDLRLPNFENSEWNWLRGTLATCDRTMGSFLDDQLHDIHVTHVCHHLFSKLPFYHSREATKHIKEVLGDYYQHEEENYFISLYKTLISCSYLREEKGILWWITHA
jgi:omega-6 fatty acid desaturase (delta-12 desaturase)